MVQFKIVNFMLCQFIAIKTEKNYKLSNELASI